MTKVAIIGTQGVPAAYGGFETLVENLLGDNCPADVEYTVFCSSKEQKERPAEYKGARLRYVPLRSHGAQSIPYDIVQMIRAARGYDVLLVLGTSGCSFLPLLRLMMKRGTRLVVNIDGLEHRRDKWGRNARKLLLYSEKQAVRIADSVIADYESIAQYVRTTYGIEPAMIAYGGDHALRTLPPQAVADTLRRYGLEPRKYAVTVCRVEPENNCHMTLEAFAADDAPMPLVFIGNWDHGDYGRRLKARYAGHPNIHILDPIYDLDTLYALRTQAALYIHGHSAGGTNPSLVEAMFAGIPIACYDVVYNRATTYDHAYYFADAPALRAIARRSDLDGAEMLRLAEEHYTWATIARQYCQLYTSPRK